MQRGERLRSRACRQESEKHHDIAARVFAGKAVGSRANCSACRRTARESNGDDDNAIIPDSGVAEPGWGAARQRTAVGSAAAADRSQGAGPRTRKGMIKDATG